MRTAESQWPFSLTKEEKYFLSSQASPFSPEEEGKSFSLGRGGLCLGDAEFSKVQLEQTSAQPGRHQGCGGFDGPPSSERVSRARIWPDVLADRTGYESSEDM